MESNKSTTFAPANENSCLFILVGAIAQLVEQRTENPCVPGSIPGGTTFGKQLQFIVTAFLLALAQLILPSEILSNFEVARVRKSRPLLRCRIRPPVRLTATII